MADTPSIPCLYCHTLNLPHEALCIHCRQPLRSATEQMQKTVVLPVSHRSSAGRQAESHKGLNGRQKAFLWRWILPLALFAPLFLLLTFLLKRPSMSVGEWLAKPVFRPSQNSLFFRSYPGWVLVSGIAGAITAIFVRLITPPTWEDLEKPDSDRYGSSL